MRRKCNTARRNELSILTVRSCRDLARKEYEARTTGAQARATKPTVGLTPKEGEGGANCSIPREINTQVRSEGVPIFLDLSEGKHPKRNQDVANHKMGNKEQHYTSLLARFIGSTWLAANISKEFYLPLNPKSTFYQHQAGERKTMGIPLTPSLATPPATFVIHIHRNEFHSSNPLHSRISKP